MSPDTELRVRELEAEIRFYSFDVPDFKRFSSVNGRPMDQPYLVLDKEQPHKQLTIAKFRFKEDAEMFLALRRKQYVDTGE